MIQSVIDVITSIADEYGNIHILTGNKALNANNFISSFEKETKQKFSPKAFRDYRLSLLGKADIIVNVRTGLSESSAFELAYNIFKGRKAPILFCTWNNSPLKTTLLRDLQDLCDISYVNFSSAEDLKNPLKNFLNIRKYA